MLNNKRLIIFFIAFFSLMQVFALQREFIISDGYSIETIVENDLNGINNLSLSVFMNNKKVINNNLIIPIGNNCPAEGFSHLEKDKDVFYIHQSFCQDFMFVLSKATFRVNKDRILLEKYEEKYMARDNPDLKIPSSEWTSENFGIKSFEETDNQFFLKLNGRK